MIPNVQPYLPEIGLAVAVLLLGGPSMSRLWKAIPPLKFGSTGKAASDDRPVVDVLAAANHFNELRRHFVATGQAGRAELMDQRLACGVFCQRPPDKPVRPVRPVIRIFDDVTPEGPANEAEEES